MTKPRPYELSVDSFASDHFHVHAISGTEAISEAWSFDVVATGPSGDDVERGALGQRATLIFNVADKPRAFYGIVAGVRIDEVHHANRAIKYILRIVPRLWLLRRKQRTRIFQNMRVPDIVSSVLLEAGIATRWQLVRAYPEREYCTQYEETDYQFVRRILAEAGIFFYFFGGGPVDSAALTADAVVGGVAAAGSAVASFVGGTDVGGLVGAAAQMAETLIPGDTVVGADDATCYPPVAGDDPAALAASTAAAMAPAIGDVLGVGDGIAGAAIGTASAVAGTVIADVLDAARAAPTIHFMGNVDAHVSRYDKTTRFTLRNSVRSSAAAFRDYDPDRPMVRLQSKAVSTQPFPPSPFEIAAEAAAAAENVATAAASVLPGPVAGVLDEVDDVVSEVDSIVNEVGAAAGQKVPSEVYEHHSPFLFPKWSFANDEAPRILRQKRRRASIAKGESGCSDFSPAHRFALQDHPAPQLDGSYVVTRVEHRGDVHPINEKGWLVYQNAFECAPAEMPYPPARRKRKSVQVTLTATVVGPDGEEIWVDEKGQIKVQFHWDREGKNDDKSSCWIRVMQPWAGASWGHQFIPRVGMEVVVVFEGGDPDKPMVLGSLYNGTHPPPFKLPDHKTKSGLRTSSTPGGHGHNELSFEDRAGHELFFMHAQRDLEERIRRNRAVHVGGSESKDVHGLSAARIGGDRLLHVDGSQRGAVGGGDRLDVKGSMDRHVGGALRATVAQETEIQLNRGLSMAISGTHAVHVGGEHPAQSDYFVEGSHSLGAKERIVIRADEGIVVQCGKTSLELSPNKLVLKSPTIEIEAEDSLECASKKGPSLSLGEKAEILSKKFSLFTEGAALELDTEVKTKGNAIKLGYDPSKPTKDDKDQKAETKPFKVKLSSYLLTPYKNKKYHVVVEGQRIEGTTDGDGYVTCDVPATARALQIRLWLSDYPQGPRREYTVELQDLKPATTIEGAKERLKNLGYYKGTVDAVEDNDLALALSEFQDDHKDTHGLGVTGKADQATLAALADVHRS